MRSEDTSDRSEGEDVDPRLVAIIVIGGGTFAIGIKEGWSVESSVIAGFAALVMSAIGYYWLQKHGEWIVQQTLAIIHMLLATKRANRRYRLKNPWRQTLPDAGRARLSAHGEQVGKIVKTGVRKVKSHPSTPFEQPDDQSSEKKQLEAPDDE